MTDGSVGIDTNVVLRYLIRDDEQQYAAAAQVMESLTATNPGFLTSVNLVEAFWVMRRAYKFSRTTCLDTIRRLIEVEVLEFDDGEGVIQALDLADAGADFADALIHTTFRQFGVTRENPVYPPRRAPGG